MSLTQRQLLSSGFLEKEYTDTQLISALFPFLPLGVVIDRAGLHHLKQLLADCSYIQKNQETPTNSPSSFLERNVFDVFY